MPFFPLSSPHPPPPPCPLPPFADHLPPPPYPFSFFRRRCRLRPPSLVLSIPVSLPALRRPSSRPTLGSQRTRANCTSPVRTLPPFAFPGRPRSWLPNHRLALVTRLPDDPVPFRATWGALVGRKQRGTKTLCTQYFGIAEASADRGGERGAGGRDAQDDNREEPRRGEGEATLPAIGGGEGGGQGMAIGERGRVVRGRWGATATKGERGRGRTFPTRAASRETNARWSRQACEKTPVVGRERAERARRPMEGRKSRGLERGAKAHGAPSGSRRRKRKGAAKTGGEKRQEASGLRSWREAASGFGAMELAGSGKRPRGRKKKKKREKKKKKEQSVGRAGGREAGRSEDQTVKRSAPAKPESPASRSRDETVEGREEVGD